jgi:hypothetical protein
MSCEVVFPDGVFFVFRLFLAPRAIVPLRVALALAFFLTFVFLAFLDACRRGDAVRVELRPVADFIDAFPEDRFFAIG